MKTRLAVFVGIILLGLVGCGEAKLKIIETKVISESEPYTKPSRDVINALVNSGGNSWSHIYIELYSTYNITNEIKELADEDRKTFWLSKGSYNDEYLVFPVYGLNQPGVKRKDLLPYAIDILPGWAKDKKTFKIYNRPKRVRLEWYEVPSHHAVSQDDESYILEDKIRLAYSLVVELKDEICWHRLNIGMKPIEGYYLNPPIAGRLIVEDVYPGITNLTAISEIRFIYRETNEE
jgi:hypothetical protein